MEKEHQILTYLQSAEEITQRQIASGTGLSLGSVNMLLKKLVKKGLIKIERLNARSLRYILTPKGLSEKAHLTLKYIKSSYIYIITVMAATEIVAERVKEQGGSNLNLYGSRDEVMEIIKLALDKAGLSYQHISSNELPFPRDTLFLVWSFQDEEKLKGQYQVVNILNLF